MANQEHLAILKQGVEAWNQWREDNSETLLQLERQDLPEVRWVILNMADLSGANLHMANLADAHLRWANLHGADLHSAHLEMVNLRRAYLHRADLRRANLRRANLADADLQEANLHRANPARADFSAATMGWTTFGNVDLSKARGLESVHHRGPSTIGIDLFYQSAGLIPEKFLRGVGIPDQFITYTKSLVGKPIKYYSAFISYSSEDMDFANRLFADLQNNNVRTWYAPEDLRIGDRFRQRIDESIKLHDKLLLVLSQHSVVSDWVEFEVEAALDKERKGDCEVLFPVRIDDAVMESAMGWAAHLRTRHIGDFSRWKDHDAYQEAIQRLLRDLKAAGEFPEDED